MPKVYWTSIAEEDLDYLLYYLSFVAQTRSTGERIYFEIQARVASLAQGDWQGHDHPDAPEGWRYVRYKRWLIFVKPSAERIDVMRIVDSARDLPRFFRGV